MLDEQALRARLGRLAGEVAPGQPPLERIPAAGRKRRVRRRDGVIAAVCIPVAVLAGTFALIGPLHGGKPSTVSPPAGGSRYASAESLAAAIRSRTGECSRT